jgi:hypothetical protein
MVLRLSVRALALTGALFWGGCLLALGVVNLAVPTYGTAFLRGVASVYPGVDYTHTVGSVLAGALYGAVDGAIGGATLAWLYNTISGAGNGWSGWRGQSGWRD